MRLTPPVPGGLQRRAPKGGMVLDGIYLPGGTTVTVGAYTVQTDPANWAPHPERFRPERWIDSDKEIAANKNAFIPFSYGPRTFSSLCRHLVSNAQKVYRRFMPRQKSRHDGSKACSCCFSSQIQCQTCARVRSCQVRERVRFFFVSRLDGQPF